ncbi:ferredoxin [Streptomyces sp. NPDC091279]|uniref:ferredoxin n=1 Tax=unclassified Streptomyces TaxID=2593676 RepID=UPI00381448D0
MTFSASPQELFRYLEERFDCAQACGECARVCVVRAGLWESDGHAGQERVRRESIACADVCDATALMLSEEDRLDEAAILVQLDWCRSLCLETAHLLDAQPAAESTAEACRACARACTAFAALLR